MKKKFVFLLALAALVSACGGGGKDTPAAGNNTGTAPVTGGDTGGSNGGDTTGNTGSAGNTGNTGNTGENPPPADTGGDTAADQQLAGRLQMVANQLVYIRTNRKIFHATSLTEFESDNGMYDVAAGSNTLDMPDASVPVPVVAPAAPIAAFGFRIDKYVQRTAEDQQTGNQKVVGRIAFSLTERAASVYSGEVAESMRLVIDGVELETDANGQLVGARARTGAQMQVHGRNAANGEASATIPVPGDTVALLSMENVLDYEGDTSSVVLLISLEKAFGSAGQALAALEGLSGHFAMDVTLSSLQMVRPAAADVEYKELVGRPIAVGSQPAVTGAGISGNVWIRRYPPQAPGS